MNTWNGRLENFAWGVLLIVLGALWLLPEDRVPKGSWLIAAGLILLGLNAARYFTGIEMSGLGLLLGALALSAGLGAALGLDLPLFPIAMILIGLGILLKPAALPHRSPQNTPQ